MQWACYCCDAVLWSHVIPMLRICDDITIGFTVLNICTPFSPSSSCNITALLELLYPTLVLPSAGCSCTREAKREKARCREGPQHCNRQRNELVPAGRTLDNWTDYIRTSTSPMNTIYQRHPKTTVRHPHFCLSNQQLHKI